MLNFITPIISAVLISMMLVSYSILTTKKLIISLVNLSLFSILAVLFYSLLKAPDVAITEVAVGSAISTIFMLFTLSIIESGSNSSASFSKKSKINYSWLLKFIAVSILFIALSSSAKLFHEFGDAWSLINYVSSHYYIQQTINDFAINNIVTAILGGYRGLDTMFETTVIFCAAFGVYSILQEKE